MNQRRKFTEEFKQEAANQVIERGYPIKEVAERLGISDKTLYESPRVDRRLIFLRGLANEQTTWIFKRST